jgi:hypothetical protein
MIELPDAALDIVPFPARRFEHPRADRIQSETLR